MFNAITEYQLHDEGMQKMRPYRKLSLLTKILKITRRCGTVGHTEYLFMVLDILHFR